MRLRKERILLGREVRLGEMKLFWCPSCNLPVVAQRICPRCGEDTRVVRLTPPGDARPAFEGDIRLIREVVGRNFGERAAEAFVRDGEVVFINRAPSVDLHHEVIAGGEVLGAVIYDLKEGDFRLTLREGGSARIVDVAERGVITVDGGAAQAILERGASLLRPGALEVRGGVKKGQEVLLLDPSGRLFAGGRATADLPPGEVSPGKGMVVKVRWKSPTSPIPPPPALMSIQDVVEANREYLKYLEQKGVEFVREVRKKFPRLPVVVSYSGGKDSLATLLVVLEAGLKPPILFVNTGLEFPETLQNVRDVARRYELDVLEATPTADFYSEIERFGPPGRDYRFCCKSLKLGPVVKLIGERFPQGVLSFIGQRRYESFGRMEKGEVWRNPWVPGQIGASPIQDWTALEVFLYILMKGAPLNPLYRRGLDRIGCWLCPATDMGDLEVIGGEHPHWERWSEFLARWAERESLPKEALRWGTWRYRRPPGWLREMARREGISLPEDLRRGWMGMLEMEEGRDRIVLKGVKDKGRLLNILYAVGEVKEGVVRTPEGEVLVEVSGQEVVLKGSAVGDLVGFLKSVAIRSQECVHCGICPGRCPTGALTLGPSGIEIDEKTCVSCRHCLLGPCPAEAYRPSRGFSF